MINKIVFFIFLIIAWFFFPIISIFLLIWFLRISANNRSIRHLSIILISFSIGLFAYSQKGDIGSASDSDIERYYIVYNQFSNMDWPIFILTRFLTNPNLIFDLVTYILSKIWPSTPQVMSLFWISISYYFFLQTIIEMVTAFGTRFTKKYIPLLLVLFLTGFSIITFATDLLKQTVATSLFLYSLVKKIQGHNKSSIFFFILAILTHSSAIILSPIYLFFKSFKKYSFLSRLTISVLIFLLLINLNNISFILLSLNNSYLNTLAHKAELISGDTVKWRINYFHYISLLFYSIIVVKIIMLVKDIGISYRKNLLPENEYSIIIMLKNISIIALFLLFANILNTHNFLRLINTFSVFYIFPLIIIYYHKNKVRNYFRSDLEGFLPIFYILYFAFYSFLNFYNRSIDPNRTYGVSIMGNDFFRFATSSVFEILRYQIR